MILNTLKSYKEDNNLVVEVIFKLQSESDKELLVRLINNEIFSNCISVSIKKDYFKLYDSDSFYVIQFSFIPSDDIDRLISLADLT